MQKGMDIRREPVAIFIVAITAVLAYAASLPGAFQFDDRPTILLNGAVQEPGLLGEYFTNPALFSGVPGNEMYRPVLLASYRMNYMAGGFRPPVWHLTNVALHMIAACLVVALALRLVRILGGSRSTSGTAPFFAGMVFALHPVNSEVVNYISSRSCSVATVGVLAALLCYLAWTRGRGRARWLALPGCVFFFLFGLGGKETAVVLVPAVIALELLDPAGGKLRSRAGRAVVRTLVLIIVLVGYLSLRRYLLGTAVTDVGRRMFAVTGHVDPFWGGGRTIFENLLTQSRVFWMYFLLLFAPVELALDRYVRVSTSILEPTVLISLAGLAVLLWMLLRNSRRRPLFTFCGLFFFFGLAPTSTLVPLNVLMNEHRLYLPMIGFAILAGVALSRLLAVNRRVGIALCLILGLCFLTVITIRNFEWQDERALWESNLRVSPESYRGRNQLGVVEYREARRIGRRPEALPAIDRAIGQYRQGAEIYPAWHSIQQNLAVAWLLRARITGLDEDFKATVKHFERCVEIRPGAKRYRRDLALVHAYRGAYREAYRHYSRLAAEEGQTPQKYIDKLFVNVIRAEPEEIRAQLACAAMQALHEPPNMKRAKLHFEKAVKLGYVAGPGEYESLFRR